ncbi:hypothetical protein H4219_003872 [Mycoemilia scoparia]|uniref:Uncharacterized protein n=1 Tax=Mycoemilia scoparia TaxID=417184 RepID=A0A9W7ZUC2_9FUNG|nr:hypothetical protein H4219_003872 [Mycoemilia scoparia]
MTISIDTSFKLAPLQPTRTVPAVQATAITTIMDDIAKSSLAFNTPVMATVDVAALLFVVAKFGIPNISCCWKLVKDLTSTQAKLVATLSSLLALLTLVSTDITSILFNTVVGEGSSHDDALPFTFEELEHTFAGAHRTVSSLITTALCFTVAHYFGSNFKDTALWVLGDSTIPDSKRVSRVWKFIGMSVLFVEILANVVPSIGFLGHLPNSHDFGFPIFAIISAAVTLTATAFICVAVKRIHVFVHNVKERHPSEISVCAMSAIQHQKDQLGLTTTKSTVDFLTGVQMLNDSKNAGLLLIVASTIAALSTIMLNLPSNVYDATILKSLFCLSAIVASTLVSITISPKQRASIFGNVLGRVMEYSPAQVHSFLTGIPPTRNRSASSATVVGGNSRARPNSIVLVDPALESASLNSDHRRSFALCENPAIPRRSGATRPASVYLGPGGRVDIPTGNLIGLSTDGFGALDTRTNRRNTIVIGPNNSNSETRVTIEDQRRLPPPQHQQQQQQRSIRSERITLSSLLPRTTGIHPTTTTTSIPESPSLFTGAHRETSVVVSENRYNLYLASPISGEAGNLNGIANIVAQKAGPKPYSSFDNLMIPESPPLPQQHQHDHAGSNNPSIRIPSHEEPSTSGNGYLSPATTPRSLEEQPIDDVDDQGFDSIRMATLRVGGDRSMTGRNSVRPGRSLSTIVNAFNSTTSAHQPILPLHPQQPALYHHHHHQHNYQQLENEDLASHPPLSQTIGFPQFLENFRDSNESIMSPAVTRPSSPSDFEQTESEFESDQSDDDDDNDDMGLKAQRISFTPEYLMTPPATPTLDVIQQEMVQLQTGESGQAATNENETESGPPAVLRLVGEATSPLLMTAFDGYPDNGKPSEVLEGYDVPQITAEEIDIVPNNVDSDDSTAMTFTGMTATSSSQRRTYLIRPKQSSYSSSNAKWETEPSNGTPLGSLVNTSGTMTVTITAHPSEDPFPEKSYFRLNTGLGIPEGLVGTLRLRGQESNTYVDTPSLSSTDTGIVGLEEDDAQLGRALRRLPGELVSRVLSYLEDAGIAEAIGEPTTEVTVGPRMLVTNNTPEEDVRKYTVPRFEVRSIALDRTDVARRLDDTISEIQRMQPAKPSSKKLVQITISNSAFKSIVKRVLDKSLSIIGKSKDITLAIDRNDRIRATLSRALHSSNSNRDNSGNSKFLLVVSSSPSVTIADLNRAINNANSSCSNRSPKSNWVSTHLVLKTHSRRSSASSPASSSSSITSKQAASSCVDAERYLMPLAKQMVAASLLQALRGYISLSQPIYRTYLDATVPLSRHIASVAGSSGINSFEPQFDMPAGINSGDWVKATINFVQLPGGDYAIKWRPRSAFYKQQMLSLSLLPSISQGSIEETDHDDDDDGGGEHVPPPPPPTTPTTPTNIRDISFIPHSIYSSPTTVSRTGLTPTNRQFGRPRRLQLITNQTNHSYDGCDDNYDNNDNGSCGNDFNEQNNEQHQQQQESNKRNNRTNNNKHNDNNDDD